MPCGDPLASPHAVCAAHPPAIGTLPRHEYDATTVEQIAAGAGVSHMTFFRHFPTKEAVVESDDYDPMTTRLIESRPPHTARESCRTSSTRPSGLCEAPPEPDPFAQQNLRSG